MIVFKGKYSIIQKEFSKEEPITLSIILALKTNDTLSFEIDSYDAGQVLKLKSSRSIVRLGNTRTQGLMAVQKFNMTYPAWEPAALLKGFSDDWNVTTGGFNNNASVSTSTGEMRLEAGLFKVAVQINVRNIFKSSYR